MAWIETWITTSENWLGTRWKNLIFVMAILAALNFSSCKNPHSGQEGQKQQWIELNDSNPKINCEVVDPIQVIKEGDDWKKYIDDIYHYPIIEKDWKYYLIYWGLEFELNHCLIPKNNNHEVVISGNREWIEYCLYDNEVYRVEEKTPSYIKISHIWNGPTIYISISWEHSKHYEENRVWNVRDY